MQPVREDGDELKALLPDFKVEELPNSHNSLMGVKGGLLRNQVSQQTGQPGFGFFTIEFVYVLLFWITDTTAFSIGRL